MRSASLESRQNSRERLKLETSQAALLRETYPQLAELRVEFVYEDGTPRPPSQQSYSHFPAARCLFRYSCPCHGCSGEFNLSGIVAELAASTGRTPLVRLLTLNCVGQHHPEPEAGAACPIRATIRISATGRTEAQT